MDTNHVSIYDLGKLARRELAADAVVAVARHIRECEACASYARRMMNARRVEEAFGLDDVEHPSDLAAYVDGDPSHRESIEAHLEWCDRCREDAGDLAEMRDHLKKRTSRPFVYAAAAVIVVALAGVAFFYRPSAPALPAPHVIHRPPAPPPVAARTPYDRADWESAVNDALQSGAVPRPRILGEIRSPLEMLRGTAAANAAALDPAGVVIDTTHPAFTWTASKDARYVVSVFDGDRRVASSGTIASPPWTPRKSLPRGRTLTWQVEIAGTSETIPAPPAPPAMFRIIDAATARDLDDARAHYASDHLLLGILYARAGLQADAEKELRAANATKILDSVRRW